MPPTTVGIVPHTHWDREWYAPFQVFRARLVRLLDEILRLAGFEHAVVWRGVPSTVTQTAFTWEAPDGSAIRAEYLYGSYSNGRDLPDDAKQLVARARSYELELGPARLPGGSMLLMNGNDHHM